MSTNQQRNETGFSVCSTASTSTTECFSFFTTATSAALSVTTALGTSSTSAATQAFPVASQYATPATALLPKSSGFSFSTPTTGILPKSSGFSFSTPTTGILPKSSGFSFSTPTTGILPKSSGFSFSTPTTGIPSNPSGFTFSTPTSAVISKPFGFGFGTQTSTVTSTLPSTGLSVISKAPATTSENGFTTVAPSGTTTKFYPPTGTDTMKVGGLDRPCDIRYQCIAVMKEYENKAFEELRVEDYAANRGGVGRIAVESTSQRTWAATASSSGFFFGNTKPLFVTTGTTNYSMAFPDSTWTYGGDLVRRKFISPVKMKVKWDIFPYLDLKRKESIRKLKSDNFSYAGATWNFFASFDPIKTHSQFGINVRTQSSSDEAFYCNCDIFIVTGRDPCQEYIANMECNFILPSAESHWAVTDILTSNELDDFLGYGGIHCIISIKRVKNPENENKDNPVGTIDCKVCQDFKNLLLSGEGSDVTLQVQDQEFKAHRSVITARSSVFAAMFHHDMKEKATETINVEDCEPSYFPVLLEFLYCGSTEKLSIENVFSLYTSADKYDVQDLKMKCIEFIEKNLSVETFCDTARFSLQHSENNLLKLTTDFFARNLKEIILTVKWQTFLAENPIQSNEFFIKAMVSNVKDD